MVNLTLPAPARYFPLDKGIYEVAPGLNPLGRDFGNGKLDSALFQITSRFGTFRRNKLEARRERISKYLCEERYPQTVSNRVNQALVDRLLAEHPELFVWTEAPGGGGELFARHTGDRIPLDAQYQLRGRGAPEEGESPEFVSAFDALCLQFECDLAVMLQTADGSDHLANIHLCAPTHWSAEGKIGKSFFEIHDPIPHVEKIQSASRALVQAMIHKGPYVRFVWGFATDDRLNHHPEAPSGQDPDTWNGRAWNSDRRPSPFLLRVERQFTWGIPEVGAGLFGIQVFFIEGCDIRQQPRERNLLLSAIETMSPRSQAYKSIERSRDSLLNWLRSGPSES